MSDLRTTGMWDEKWADEKLVISKFPFFPEDKLEADRFRTAKGGLLLFFFIVQAIIYLFLISTK